MLKKMHDYSAELRSYPRISGIQIILEFRGFVFRLWTSCAALSNGLFIWAAEWQNQQSECAPSEGSDQPGHPHSEDSD